MDLQKVVTPVKDGVQIVYNLLNTLDFGFRRNDGLRGFQTYYEISDYSWQDFQNAF